ncbi:uncharacterized protein F5147DRAFT_777805 [Suillus discolor]|uniref:Cullin family profile domain-containing protein n=1 Tax=Suillus discolor TaxID=1912936 RepID=A0A9P7JPS5_9AGAM|nr:uncharacterized protein F5147DRAFT_777805 [Suillus discolor]KAG2097940.1 hypothetical protein F5147DRAFT_777805 [Suillus discolor]
MLISLVTFSDTSKAFTAYRSTVVDVDNQSASHPRKTPRLDADSDSDSGSASRSRDSVKGENVDRGGPVRIQVHGFAGGVVGSALNKVSDNLFVRLFRSIRAFLEKGSNELRVQRMRVSTPHAGALYASIGWLKSLRKEGVERIGHFVETCAWFEGQVNPSLPSIHDLAFTRFRERIVSYFIVEKLQKGISTWGHMGKERRVHIHRPFLKELVSHLITHHVYDAIFERHFVEQTREYFSKESYQMVEVEKAKAKVFLAHCNQRTNEEQGRARDVMLDGTSALVKDAAIRALFEVRLEWMAKEVFMECKGTADLKKAYALFSSVDRAFPEVQGLCPGGSRSRENHRALAKRLLLERSASDDFEKAMLKKLKEKYDPEFGMGDHMFNDLALSQDIMREYHARIRDDSSAKQLSVMVLQRSVWPFLARTKHVDLPSSVSGTVSGVRIKYQGHKLDWDHSLGTATVKARFAAGPKDLTVSLYQDVVLLLLNKETDRYRYILEETHDGELKRTLQSLAWANKKVLKKRPVGKDVNDHAVFYFNPEFTDPWAKVHINSI